MRTAARHLLIALVVLAVGAPAASAACDRTWNGSTGDWSTGANWTPASVPGPGDVACIGSGTATYTGGSPTTVAGIELTGGTVDGTGAILAGTLAWSGGDLGGSVAVTVSGAATITDSNGRDLTGTSTLRLNGATTSTANNLRTLGGTLEIGGTLTISGQNTWLNGSGGLLHVTPTGSIVHTSTFSSTIPWPLDNDGTIRATASTLNLTGTSSATSTGQLGGGPGTGEALVAGGQLTAGAGFRLARGGGVSGGTLTVNGAGVAPAAPDQGAAILSSGTIDGTGSLPLSGLAWSGGDLGGSVAVTVTGAATITDSNGRDLNGTSTLRLNGATTSTANNLRTFGGTLEIGGTLTISGQNVWLSGSGGLLHVTPTGSIVHTSTFPSTIPWPLDNDGTIRATASTLNLTGTSSATSTGQLGGGPGTGEALVAGGQLTAGAGFRLARGGGVSGGTLTVNGAGVAPAAPDQGAAILSSGTIDGSGSLPLSGLAWSGGDLGGSVAVTVTGAATITDSNGRDLNGTSTLRLNGATTSTANNLRTFGGTLEIGGTLTISGQNVWLSGSGGLLHVTPTGSIVHTSTFPSTIPWPLDNDGTIRATASTLNLTGTSSATSTGQLGGGPGTGRVSIAGGSYAAGAGHRLARGAELGGGLLTQTGAGALPATTDRGTVFLTSGMIDGTRSIPLAALDWSGGDLGGSVAVTVSGAATISGSTIRDLSGTSTLRLNGATTSTANNLRTFGGTLEIGGTLTLGVENHWANGSSGGLHVLPTGSVIHAATGTSDIPWPVQIDGMFDLRKGLLDLNGTAVAFGPTATVQGVLAAATAGTGFGQLRVPAGATLDGHLRGVALAPFAPARGQRFPIVLLSGTTTGAFADAFGFVGDDRAFDVDATAADVALRVVGVPPTPGDSPGDDAVGNRADLPGALSCDAGRTRCYLLLSARTARRLRGDAAWLLPGDEAALARALCASSGALVAPIGGCDALSRLLAATGREALAFDLDLAAGVRGCFGAYLEPGGRAVVDDLAFAISAGRAFSWGADGRALPTGLRCSIEGAVWRVAGPTFADGTTFTAGLAPTRAAAPAPQALAPTLTLVDAKATGGYRLRLVARRAPSGRAILEARLGKPRPSLQEHVYEFPLTPAQLRVARGLGSGRLLVRLGRYGRVDLTIAGVGAVTRSGPPKGCTGPDTLERAGTARGTIRFTPPAAKGARKVSARSCCAVARPGSPSNRLRRQSPVPLPPRSRRSRARTRAARRSPRPTTSRSSSRPPARAPPL